MAEKLSVLSRLGYAFNRCNFLSFCLNPPQLKCFEYLLKGKDIVAVLSTGFDKSLLLNSTRLFPILLATWAAFCTRVRDRNSRGYPLPPATQATQKISGVTCLASIAGQHLKQHVFVFFCSHRIIPEIILD